MTIHGFFLCPHRITDPDAVCYYCIHCREHFPVLPEVEDRGGCQAKQRGTIPTTDKPAVVSEADRLAEAEIIRKAVQQRWFRKANPGETAAAVRACKTDLASVTPLDVGQEA